MKKSSLTLSDSQRLIVGRTMHTLLQDTSTAKLQTTIITPQHLQTYKLTSYTSLTFHSSHQLTCDTKNKSIHSSIRNIFEPTDPSTEHCKALTSQLCGTLGSDMNLMPHPMELKKCFLDFQSPDLAEKPKELASKRTGHVTLHNGVKYVFLYCKCQNLGGQ